MKLLLVSVLALASPASDDEPLSEVTQESEAAPDPSPPPAPAVVSPASPPVNASADEFRRSVDHASRLVDAGNLAAAADTLESALKLVPDPTRDASLRMQAMRMLHAVLLQVYAKTGDTAVLQRLEDRWLGPVRGALAQSGTPTAAAEAAETVASLEAVRAELVAAASVSATAAPAVSTAPKRVDRPGRSMRISGAVLMGTGIAAVGVMIYGSVVTVQETRRIRDYTAEFDRLGMVPNLEQRQAATDKMLNAFQHRTIAIVTGISGGAMLATGIVLYVAGVRRGREAATLGRWTPIFGPRMLGVAVGGRF